ncbi:glycoside hydrolase family 43 protein [Sphingomonas sp.]|uniref:glycoside hydrolase family 43 protein n=1 Tax=Sphingomonas sp. TaxID=28214 RepID=UPI003CC578B7
MNALRIAAILLAAALSASAAPARVDHATATFSRFRYEGHQPANAVPLPPGRYRNPIIAGSYSDPSILRVGRDYYLTNASMTFWPGLPIFHSRDLVHWRQIGAALNRPGQMRIAGLDTWLGIYAPALAQRNGVYYLISTCQGCGGNFILTARRPAGPWSDPHWLPFAGIDPSLFVDADGRAWVVNNGPPDGAPRWNGHRAIWLQAIDLQHFTMTGERRVIVDGGADPARRPFWIEGPHLFRQRRGYLLICAEGGTKEHHHEVAFRASTLAGPWRPAPEPILSQLDLDPARAFPVVQAGHADLVETPAGDWWAVFLASRPWGPAELDYNTGRETFLLPVAWRRGWPVILPPRQPVPLTLRAPRLPSAPTGEPHGGDYAFADDFGGTALRAPWSMLGSPVERWWRTGAGSLRLTARAMPLGGAGQPSFLGVRQQHMYAQATVRVTVPGGSTMRAGLTAYQGTRRFFALSVTALTGGRREVRLERMTGAADPADGTLVATVPLAASGPVDLRVVADGPRYTFSYAVPGGSWRAVGDVQDGSILSTSSASGFTGVMLGLFAYRSAD